MEFLIISGMSGAGKSRAAGILEDLDFYCVDNMPVVLIPKFAELCLATRGRYERVALVTDVRGSASFDELFGALDELQKLGLNHKILFVEASLSSIVNRYKETRRRHPLSSEGSIETAVMREKQMLEPVRSRADYIIDTSDMQLSRLQKKLFGIFVGGEAQRNISIKVMSFGFKYGLPIDADLVFDVRFLPNPFYLNELKELSGLDEPVSNFIFKHQAAVDFMKKLTGMIEFLLPLYIEEGKHSLIIAIGCTGGRHRSVALTRALSDSIAEKGYANNSSHRDINKT